MEKEVNTGKGILFAFGGMIIGFAIWTMLIAFLGTGTGGAIGGALGGILGSLVALGYQKGVSKSGVAGYVIVAMIALIGAVGAIVLGITIYLYNSGMGRSLGDALGLMLDNSSIRSALIMDISISGVLAVGSAIWILVKGNKEEKEKNGVN